MAPKKWEMVRVVDRRPDNYYWISPRDLPLKFELANATVISACDSYVIPIDTEEGERIILPAYEAFRAFYGLTSDLAVRLISADWDTIKDEFVLGQEEKLIGEVTHWHLDLCAGVPRSAFRVLALLSFRKFARDAANRIHPHLLTQSKISDDLWLPSVPPLRDEKFLLRAHTQALPFSKSTLISKIEAFGPCLGHLNLSYTYPEEVRVSPDEPREESKEPSEESSKPAKKSYIVNTPSDKRPTLSSIQLPSPSVDWLGFSNIDATPRKTRWIPGVNSKSRVEGAEGRGVSVGDKSDTSNQQSAQFTPEEDEAIKNRFEEITHLVRKLQEEGGISEFQIYPIARPFPVENPQYCQFLKHNGEKRLSWSIIKKPRVRARLALVLKLVASDNEIYWIETELKPNEKGYKSLAILIKDGGELSTNDLTDLLDICAFHHGRWPIKLLAEQYKNAMYFSGRVHSKVNKTKLSKNVILGAFSYLLREKKKRGK